MNFPTVVVFFCFLVSQVSALPGTNHSDTLTTSGRHVTPNPVSKLEIEFIGCKSEQEEQIKQSARYANAMIDGATSFLKKITAKTQHEWYTKWFGVYDSPTYTRVKLCFKNMRGRATSLVYNCEACPGDKSQVSTYLMKQGPPGMIRLCQGFWEAPITGIMTNTKSGRIIRELSRVRDIGETNDRKLNEEAAQALAKTDYYPKTALIADSYMYFAETLLPPQL